MSNKHRRSATLATKVSSKPQEATVVAHLAKDVDQAKLEAGCKPGDLVAWSDKHKLFARLPLASLDSERITNEIAVALDQLSSVPADHSSATPEIPSMNTLPTEPTTEPLTTANSRRLSAAVEILKEEFSRVAANQRWGKLTLEIPFEGGDAQDVVCQTTRRLRMK